MNTPFNFSKKNALAMAEAAIARGTAHGATPDDVRHGEIVSGLLASNRRSDKTMDAGAAAAQWACTAGYLISADFKARLDDALKLVVDRLESAG